MDRSTKPAGFVKSEPEIDYHLRGMKPEPPTSLNYQSETRPIGDTNNGKNTSPTDPDDFTLIEHPKDDVTKTDFGVGNVLDIVKTIDVNRYATKKTIAQGMLDIALLTANASQLKYILQVGKQHEFYTLMLTLICTSIALQILSGFLSLSLNLLRDRRMEDSRYAFSVEWMGRARIALSFIVFLDNIMISAFDPMGLSSLIDYNRPVTPGKPAVGILFVIVGGLDINRPRDHRAADIINDIILTGVFLISLINVIISGFGMESYNRPQEFLTYRRDVAMLNDSVICVMLGSTFNINKTQDQPKANVWNNVTLALMVLTVAVNVIISAFDMRYTDPVAPTSDSGDHGETMSTFPLPTEIFPSPYAKRILYESSVTTKLIFKRIESVLEKQAHD